MKFSIRDGVLGYNRKVVLSDVNLEIETGDIICVLGRNGAGKTTLFKSILGILPLIDGRVFLDDREITSIPRSEFARIVAYVPQAHAVPFSFTVTEVVLLGRSAHMGMFSSPSGKDRMIAHEALEMMNISHLSNRSFMQLSGGEQQMVIIARALAQQTSFIIMDEPTSSLDFGNQIKLIRQVKQLQNRSLGIIMATHSPDHTFMCDAKVAIVDSKTVRTRGYCNSSVNEDMLRELYGVDIYISDIMRDDLSRRICIPAI